LSGPTIIFVVIFDREGSHYKLLSELWKHRIDAITYRKAVVEMWPESEFLDTEVPVTWRRQHLHEAGRTTVEDLGRHRIDSRP